LGVIGEVVAVEEDGTIGFGRRLRNRFGLSLYGTMRERTRAAKKVKSLRMKILFIVELLS
jgi:hypothetical protein